MSRANWIHIDDSAPSWAEQFGHEACVWLEEDTLLGLEVWSDEGLVALERSPDSLRSIRVEDVEIGAAQVRGWQTSPWWRCIEELSLRVVRFQAEALRVLAEGPAPTRLHRLDLGANALDAAAIATIGGAHWGGQVRHLVLDELDLEDDALPSLFALENLRQVKLAANSLGDGACRAMAGSHWPSRLTELDLFANRVESAGVRALAEVAWPELATLSLQGNAIGDDGLEALLEGQLPALDTLMLNDTGLSSAGLIRATRAWPLAGLRSLGLGANEVDDAAVVALAACSGLRGLRSLDLSGRDSLGPTSVAALTRSPHLSGLEKLVCNSRRLDDDAAEPLWGARWPLHTIGLDSNNLDAGAVHGLTRAPFAPQLRHLSLCFNQLDDNAVDALCACTTMRSLNYLDLSENAGISRWGWERLAAWPGLRGVETLLVSVEDEDVDVLTTLRGASAGQVLRV